MSGVEPLVAHATSRQPFHRLTTTLTTKPPRKYIKSAPKGGRFYLAIGFEQVEEKVAARHSELNLKAAI